MGQKLRKVKLLFDISALQSNIWAKCVNHLTNKLDSLINVQLTSFYHSRLDWRLKITPCRLPLWFIMQILKTSNYWFASLAEGLLLEGKLRSCQLANQIIDRFCWRITILISDKIDTLNWLFSWAEETVWQLAGLSWVCEVACFDDRWREGGRRTGHTEIINQQSHQYNTFNWFIISPDFMAFN